MNRMMPGQPQASLWLAWALTMAASPSWAQGLELSVDPTTLSWAKGQQDLTVKVNLQNKGAAFDIWAGTFYVNVTGGDPANLPTIQNVKLAGFQETSQYLNGTFLTGVSGPSFTPSEIGQSQWTQYPLQSTDPDADASTPGLEPVSSFNSSEINITFDRLGGTDGPAQTIPGNATAPFAEITLRRSGDLAAAGSWTLNLFRTVQGTAPSFFSLAAGGDKVMGTTSATVSVVPEPETITAVVGLVLVAFQLFRRSATVA